MKVIVMVNGKQEECSPEQIELLSALNGIDKGETFSHKRLAECLNWSMDKTHVVLLELAERGWIARLPGQDS